MKSELISSFVIEFHHCIPFAVNEEWACKLEHDEHVHTHTCARARLILTLCPLEQRREING